MLKQEWEEADGSFLSSYARLLESGFLRLTGEDPDVAAQGLPKAFHALCPLLANEDEAGRNAASECLTRLSEQCVTDAMIQAALERR